jgi:hypothetical protein
MINEHDIADFQDIPEEENPYLLAEFHSATCNGPAQTKIEKGYFNEAALCITQDNLGSRSFENDEDMVVLDRLAQHTLYIILKARFEEHADAR